MAKSTDLFDLIHSLSGNEKRYFMMQTALQSGHKKYERLYKLMEKQKVYDEKLIMKELGKDPMARQLSVAKNYLYNLIMKCLEGYYHSFGAEVRSQITRIEILYYKGLYKQCSTLITRVKKKIKSSERYHLMPEVLVWERMLVVRKEDLKRYEKNIARIKVDEDEAIAIIQEVNRLRYAYNRIYATYLRRGRGLKPNEKNALEEDRKLMFDTHKKDKDMTFNERYYRYSGQAYYCLSVGEFKQALSITRKVLKTFDDYPVQIALLPGNYLSALMTHLLMLFHDGQYDEILEHCKRVRNLEEVVPQLKASKELLVRIFEVGPTYELAVYSDIGDVKRGMALIPEIEQGLKQYHKYISEQGASVINFNMAIIYFLAGEYKKSLHCINRIINETINRLMPDFAISVYLLRFLLHIELDNESLYAYLIRSTYRQIQKLEFNTEITDILLQQIKALLEVSDKQDQEAQLVATSKVLKKLKGNPDMENLMSFFDIRQWIDSRIRGVSLVSVMEEDLKKKPPDKRVAFFKVPSGVG
ncbi:MAG: hypothetical protein KDD36_10620 [Flavobacteriales bacterium]|nr:hypothetical protein [Flavobacteriales bacterium]